MDSGYIEQVVRPRLENWARWANKAAEQLMYPSRAPFARLMIPGDGWADDDAPPPEPPEPPVDERDAVIVEAMVLALDNRLKLILGAHYLHEGHLVRVALRKHWSHSQQCEMLAQAHRAIADRMGLDAGTQWA